MLQIDETCDDESLQRVVAQNRNLLFDCGFNKGPVALKDKPNIIRIILLHKIILTPLAEITQFKEGLKTFGILNIITYNPEVMKEYFSISHKNILTGGAH